MCGSLAALIRTNTTLMSTESRLTVSIAKMTDVPRGCSNRLETCNGAAKNEMLNQEFQTLEGLSFVLGFEPYRCFNKRLGLEASPSMPEFVRASKMGRAAKSSNGSLSGSVFTEVDGL